MSLELDARRLQCPRCAALPGRECTTVARELPGRKYGRLPSNCGVHGERLTLAYYQPRTRRPGEPVRLGPEGLAAALAIRDHNARELAQLRKWLAEHAQLLWSAGGDSNPASPASSDRCA